jgi:hypothetical protein
MEKLNDVLSRCEERLSRIDEQALSKPPSVVPFTADTKRWRPSWCARPKASRCLKVLFDACRSRAVVGEEILTVDASCGAVSAEEKSELSYEYTETVLPTVFAGAAEQVTRS